MSTVLRDMRSELRSAPWLLVVGFIVFLVVFLLTAITSTLVAFILPPSYAGKVHLRIGPAQAASAHPQGRPDLSSSRPNPVLSEIAVIQSEMVLGTVITNLNLREIWGQRYANGERLTSMEAMEALKKRLSLRPVEGGGILELQAFDEDPESARAIANAVAESYRDYSRSSAPNAAGATVSGAAPTRPQVAILDHAVRPEAPARPNKPLLLFLGALSGTVLGAIAAVAAVVIICLLRRRLARRQATA
jgi:uncharacterized protein involved in exopolysaccharide biosynthesis